MKKIAIIYLLSMTCLTAQAQWQNITSISPLNNEPPLTGSLIQAHYISPDTVVITVDYLNTGVNPPQLKKASLYMSNNGGQSWKHIYSDTISMYAWFHDSKTANIYRACKPYEACISWTNDGGKTVSFRGNMPYKSKLPDFLSPSTGFVLSYLKDTLFRTADTGKTWQGYTGGYDAFKEIPRFINDNTGYVIAYKSIVADLLKTVDGGKTWSVSVKDMLNYLTYGNANFFAASEDVFYATSVSYPTGDLKRVFKSADGGKTWKSVSKGLDTTGNIKYEYIYFSSPDNGFVINNLGFVYRTIDGGENWGYQDRLVFNGNRPADQIQCLGDSICWATKFEYVLNYYFTTNGGGTTVGINEQATEERQELLLYPNPASGRLQVKMPGMNVAQLSVYDMLGREVAVSVISRQADGCELDISALQPGVYVLRVQDGKRLSMGRFVVKD